MKLETYKAKIEIDGVEIPEWKGFLIEEKIGFSEKRVRGEFERPFSNINENSKLTIKEGMEGVWFTPVSEVPVRRLEGGRQSVVENFGSDVVTKAPPLIYVFVNKNWLDQIAPGWKLRNGIIYAWTPPQGKEYKLNGSSLWRLYVSELPSQDIRDSDFKCIVRESLTYKDVGRFIAQKLGYDFKCNVPDLPVLKTLYLYPDAPYWDIIKRLFAKWRPHIFIKDNPPGKGGYKKTIWVVDQGKEKQAKPVLGKGQHIKLTTDAFTVYDWRFNTNDDSLIDHVIIVGASKVNTYEMPVTAMEIGGWSSIGLSGQRRTLTTTEQYEYENEIAGQEKLRDITPQQHIVKSKKTTTTVVWELSPPYRTATEKEVMEAYGGDGLVYRRTTNYHWSGFDRPLGCDVLIEAKVPRVAGGRMEVKSGGSYQLLPRDYEFIEVEKKRVRYKPVIPEVGAVNCDVTVEALCVSWKMKEVDGYYSYGDTRPILDHLKISGAYIAERNNEDGEGWFSEWRTVSTQTIRYSLISTSLLEKETVDITYVPHYTFHSRTEHLPIPKKKVTRTLSSRWEYYSQGEVVVLRDESTPLPDWLDLHPAITLYEPDVSEESQAREIAERQMTRRNTWTSANDALEGVIETTIPIFTVPVGGTISLPACTKRFFNWRTRRWEDVTLPSKTYWIVGNTRITRFEGSPDSPQRTLRTFNRIEIKEYY